MSSHPTSTFSGRRKRATLPRSRRLKKRRLIQSLFARSRRESSSIQSGPVLLLYRRLPDVETSTRSPVQIGFAVARSAGNAVRRNRIKRLMREEYRTCREEVESKIGAGGGRFIVMAVLRNPHADEASIRPALRHTLDKLMEREAPPVATGTTGTADEVEQVT